MLWFCQDMSFRDPSRYRYSDLKPLIQLLYEDKDDLLREDTSIRIFHMLSLPKLI